MNIAGCRRNLLIQVKQVAEVLFVALDGLLHLRHEVVECVDGRYARYHSTPMVQEPFSDLLADAKPCHGGGKVAPQIMERPWRYSSP